MDQMSPRGGPKKYFRLTRAERNAIQHALDEIPSRSCRSIAKSLGRSASSVRSEVLTNRVVRRGPGRNEKVTQVPEDACPRLLAWPHVCNGCKRRRYHCTRTWQAEYRSARAQALSDEERSRSREGIDRSQQEFELIMSRVRDGLSRGLSPEQIVGAYTLDVSVASVYRWIEKGYADTANLELRRKVSYKPRKKKRAPKSTSHGAQRSFSAFMELDEEERASACEMDTVVGRVRDAQCLLTLYLRPFKFQLALLLADKDAEEVARALSELEGALGHEGYRALFGLIITDNGTEFADHEALERSALCPGERRSRLFYCDVRQSQQKPGCERNHVEMRKVLPKGRNISFDGLTKADCSLLMSHVNSQPRPSLGGMSPIRMLKTCHGQLAERLLGSLGVSEVDVDDLDLTPRLLNEAHIKRGDEPLVK